MSGVNKNYKVDFAQQVTFNLWLHSENSSGTFEAFLVSVLLVLTEGLSGQVQPVSRPGTAVSG